MSEVIKYLKTTAMVLLFSLILMASTFAFAITPDSTFKPGLNSAIAEIDESEPFGGGE